VLVSKKASGSASDLFSDGDFIGSSDASTAAATTLGAAPLNLDSKLISVATTASVVGGGKAASAPVVAAAPAPAAAVAVAVAAAAVRAPVAPAPAAAAAVPLSAEAAIMASLEAERAADIKFELSLMSKLIGS
jgi:hypothetical protein